MPQKNMPQFLLGNGLYLCKGLVIVKKSSTFWFSSVAACGIITVPKAECLLFAVDVCFFFPGTNTRLLKVLS